MQVSDAFQQLRGEMQAYYGPMRLAGIAANPVHAALRQRVFGRMDAYAASHPEEPAILVKARFHEVVAEEFEPVLFAHGPFFFEMGLRPAECWGTPRPQGVHAWMKTRREHRCHDLPEYAWLRLACNGNPKSPLHIWQINDVFDFDHHCPNYTRLIEEGFAPVLARLEAVAEPPQAPGSEFRQAAARSIRAMLRCAERFAEAAEARLGTATDPEVRTSLERIAASARHVPLHPARTFYEGLAAVLFLREGLASLEGIGISVLGHLDRTLIRLYRQDLAAGRLNREEAADLLARWMLHTDVKFHVDDNPWPETSTCIELGGCDDEGRPLWNDLTELIIETHRTHGLINPKLNCRYSAESPAAYLDAISRATLAGHNHFALLNDDVLIPANVRMGKTLAEARRYVNGGCQETMVEGVEHTAGAYYYFNLARMLDLCLLGAPPGTGALPEPVRRLVPETLPWSPDFDGFYAACLEAIGRAMVQGADWLREAGSRWPEVLPCPLFSAALDGPVDAGMDYTAGGARHNLAGIAMVGFATLVDSLAVLRRAVFEERWATLDGLCDALRADWQGYGALRARILQIPRFGEADSGTDRLAKRVAADLRRLVGSLRNERGGPFQASFFVYYAFVRMGATTRATPDGRRHGDPLSQGVAPGRVRPVPSLTSTVVSLASIDFRDYAGNAVLDVQFPAGSMRPETLSAAFTAFARLGGPTIQPCCVSVADLRDAQAHPERHRGLTVRISGLSARFVALQKDVQDEIIGRTAMA